MAPVCSVVIHKDLLPRAQPLHQYIDLFPIKNNSVCLRCALLEGRKLCHKRFGSQRCEAYYTGYKRSYKPCRKLSAVPPLVNYGVERNPSSNTRNVSQIVKSSTESNDPSTGSICGQLTTLDSYFSKFDGVSKEVPEDPPKESSAGKRIEHRRSMSGLDKTDTVKITSELGSLDHYFDKLNTNDPNPKPESKFDQQVLETSSMRRPEFLNEENNEGSQVSLQRQNVFSRRSSFKNESSISFEDRAYEELETDEFSDFYLINLFAAIDIAVFLFEVASPVRDSNFGQLSLPLLYGAKDNKLILDGEWWRLVTPMFLHSGIPQVALSCWVLLTFGPQVCRAYGLFTFFLIYLLGGICANMISFIHTPELTVSGTGPIFAIIGAWLVYQFQNKEAISKEVSDEMYRKAIIATTLSFFLADSLQIDQWTHVAAAISGVLYGFFTCPTMQLNDSTTKNNPKEGAAITPPQADPLKSALTFTIFILALCPLVYVFVTGLDISELDSFLE